MIEKKSFILNIELIHLKIFKAIPASKEKGAGIFLPPFIHHYLIQGGKLRIDRYYCVQHILQDELPKEELVNY